MLHAKKWNEEKKWNNRKVSVKNLKDPRSYLFTHGEYVRTKGCKVFLHRSSRNLHNILEG